ncbi:DUF72 domain-containing protein [Methylobacterium haplocladii]|uniref:DUF72 domain-containing protein n=1 Tax=Methylobacterium haplocladii TaxID=1176176 RepID=A0A512IKR9_9HYPH|nr:DUF72 domain-containing protein [Methylobacterium haplocladii]GEO98291.1 hypothetical protein MHA02_06790 [Methylobacterium haplocladii]GJD84315.1 hypothetical protein HPGCJGGD_2191 [Methylobacterium haplocladii]GLS58415.1 hypothetical protein GCM10007887_10750 [Methylobacterium haplocladii]
MAGQIHVGVGGWSFEEWRGAFYPKEIRKAGELAYMAERLTAIEINATFYGSQKPEVFRRWASETPEGFRFSLKASRYTTTRRVLAEGAESIKKFFETGPTAMGDKLGPILWQLPATKRFDRDDIAAFLELLPVAWNGRPLRHVVEAGHESFADPAFVALLREAKAEVAQVVLDDPDHPTIADVTADFVYLRLQRSRADVETGYSEADLDTWAKRLNTYAAGGVPDDLPTIGGDTSEKRKRDVFAFFISGAKVRNPAAATALIEKL